MPNDAKKIIFELIIPIVELVIFLEICIQLIMYYVYN